MNAVASKGDKLSLRKWQEKNPPGSGADVVLPVQGGDEDGDEDGGEDTQQPASTPRAPNTPKKARRRPRKAAAAAAPATGDDADIVNAVRAKQGTRGSLSGADEEVIRKVAELQRVLVDIGLLDADGVDGIFGSQTARATRNAYYDQT